MFIDGQTYEYTYLFVFKPRGKNCGCMKIIESTKDYQALVSPRVSSVEMNVIIFG